MFTPHVARRWGGLGLDLRGQAVVFEEAGYSLFGPLALNCAAPDVGNAHLLHVVADDGQRERYLGGHSEVWFDGCEVSDDFTGGQ